MHEYKQGTLITLGIEKEVRRRKQAIAIAMSEAGISNRSNKKKRVRSSTTKK